MKIIINNEKYMSWAERFDKDSIDDRVHYFPGDMFEVIPYRHNKEEFYEVEWNNLTLGQKILCPIISSEHVFWIDKRHTVEFIYELPKELFEI